LVDDDIVARRLDRIDYFTYSLADFALFREKTPVAGPDEADSLKTRNALRAK